MRIEVVGVYEVPDASEPCHLVEVAAYDVTEPFDVGQFTQEEPGQPPENWQVPYDEGFLDPSGERVVGDNWDEPDDSYWRGTIRLVFFLHHLDLGRPLRTPTDDVPLPAPSPRPERLNAIQYEPPG